MLQVLLLHYNNIGNDKLHDQGGIDEDSDDDESSQSSGELSLGGLCVMSLSLAEWEVKFART